MTIDTATVQELSEAEKIELDRRIDIAYAVIPAAARLLEQRSQLDEQIKEESGALKSHWRWGIFVLAGLIHYFVLNGGTSFTWASWIALITLISWYAKQYDIYSLKRSRDVLSEKLYDLEVTWKGATGNGSFWDIFGFVKDYGFNAEDEEFRKWWAEQYAWILQKVCGWEKGNLIAEDRAKRSAKFDQDMAKIRHKE